jgi:hypothetical protein
VPDEGADAEDPMRDGNGFNLPRLAGPLAFAVLGFVAFAAIVAERPPRVVAADAPAEEFSAARAMRDVRVIAQRPHPTGSADNLRVRYYLLARLRELGLDARIERSIVARRNRAGPDVIATVHNVVGRLRGSAPEGAVMLVAHYDSVTTGPGAGDDAAGVAAILEAARALRAGPAPRDDVIVLLTDGEELGLMGAQAYVEAHAPADKVKAVLNFEARGNAGPVTMFEASRPNSWLISRLADRAPYPRASSFAGAIYERTPHDTDFSVFLRAGLAGMNFAAIGCLPCYHTRLDEPANLDPRTLQHHGSYALALARNLADAEAPGTPSGDSVYFTIGSVVFHYSDALAVPIAALVAVLLVVMLIANWRAARVRWSGVLLGFFAFFAAGALAVAEAWLGWHAMAWVAGERVLPSGTTYGGTWFALSFIAFISATLWALYARLGRLADYVSVGAGVLIAWTLGMIAASMRIAGASYLVTWPLFFAILAMGQGAAERAGAEDPWRRMSRAVIACAPGIAVLVPTLVYAVDGTLLFALFAALIVALMAALVAPYVEFLSAGRPSVVAATLAFAAVLLFGAGLRSSTFGPSAPRPDSIFYHFDASSRAAGFVSLDERPDHWTAQFLKFNPRAGSIAKLLGADPATVAAVTRGTAGNPASALRALGGQRTIEADAPVLELAAPTFEIVSDRVEQDARVVRARIRSGRGAPVVLMVVGPGVEVRRVVVAGRSPPGGPSDGWAGWFWSAPREGFELALVVGMQEPFTVTITDISFGLPRFPGRSFSPRPADVMPTPFTYVDSTTQVTRSFTVGGVPPSRETPARGLAGWSEAR